MLVVKSRVRGSERERVGVDVKEREFQENVRCGPAASEVSRAWRGAGKNEMVSRRGEARWRDCWEDVVVERGIDEDGDTAKCVTSPRAKVVVVGSQTSLVTELRYRK